MDSSYVFLCGVMWCRFGQQDAGKELLRAADVRDPDITALAWAMLAKGATRLRELEKTATCFSHDPWGKAMWMRSCAVCKALLTKLNLRDSVRCRCGWQW